MTEERCPHGNVPDTGCQNCLIDRLTKLVDEQREAIAREHDLYLTAHRENMAAGLRMASLREQIGRLGSKNESAERRAAALGKDYLSEFNRVKAAEAKVREYEAQGEHDCLQRHKDAQTEWGRMNAKVAHRDNLLAHHLEEYRVNMEAMGKRIATLMEALKKAEGIIESRLIYRPEPLGPDLGASIVLEVVRAALRETEGGANGRD